MVLIRLTKLRFGPWLGLREQIWSRLSGSGCPMPCKWYLIRLAKIRFGPCLSGSVRTFLVRHRRQLPSGMRATRLPRMFPLFAVLPRTAPERRCFAGLCIVRIAAGAIRALLVYGYRHGSRGINRAWMHRRIRPHSLHKNPHSTTYCNSRGFVSSWF